MNKFIHFLFTVICIVHFPQFNAQMCCTRYEMAHKQSSVQESMHTLCTVNEQPLHVDASTILGLSLSHTTHI